MSNTITGTAANFDPTVAFTLTGPADGDALNAASVEDNGTVPKTGFQPLANATEYFRENSIIGAIFGEGDLGAGIFDGAGAVSGCTLAAPVYTATQDLTFTDITISTGVTLKMAGFRLFGTGTLTMQGTAKITCNGAVGAAGAGGVGGAGGAGGGTGGILGAAAGNSGAAGGLNGGSSVTLSGALGQYGGVGGAGAGGGAPGVVTFSAPTAIMGAIHVSPSLWTGMMFGASGVTVAQGGSGGTGGQGSGAEGGGGGGGGGGVLLIGVRQIAIANTCALEAKGGTGGAAQGGGGGCGGGGGGGGGSIIFYFTRKASGVLPATITNFTGGAGGAGFPGGTNGTAGTTGNNTANLHQMFVNTF